MRGGLEALDGQTDEAARRYTAALQQWRHLGLPWEEALTAIDMATVLDPGDPAVVGATEAARTILARLGAAVMLERLEAAARQPARAAGVLTTKR